MEIKESAEKWKKKMKKRKDKINKKKEYEAHNIVLYNA